MSPIHLSRIKAPASCLTLSAAGIGGRLDRQQRPARLQRGPAWPARCCCPAAPNRDPTWAAAVTCSS